MNNLFEEGDTYYVVEGSQLIKSVWDDISVEMADESTNYYSSLFDYIKRNGGISLSSENKIPTSGFMVSLMGTEMQLAMDTRGIEDAVDFMHRHCPKDKYFGAWVDGDTLYLDRSINIQDREVAIAFGKANEQIAIYDVEKGESIRLTDES